MTENDKEKRNLEYEILRGREFSLADRVGRQGSGSLKGASPVAKDTAEQQAAKEEGAAEEEPPPLPPEALARAAEGEGNPSVAALLARNTKPSQEILDIQEERAKGMKTSRKFFLFSVAFLLPTVPITTLQVLARMYWGLVSCVDVITVVFVFVMGALMLITALSHGLVQFLLVVILPLFGVMVFFMSPLTGVLIVLGAQLYVLYFGLIRVKSPVFKGVFLSFLITCYVTGPAIIGMHNVAEDIYDRVLEATGSLLGSGL